MSRISNGQGWYCSPQRRQQSHSFRPRHPRQTDTKTRKTDPCKSEMVPGRQRMDPVPDARDTTRGLDRDESRYFRVSAPDSLTDPELAGPVSCCASGKFDIPVERLTGVEVPSGSPRGTITLPLFKGAVMTPSGLKPAWYIILDAGDQAEADRLGVNFSRKLRNAGDAARPATRRADGTFLFESAS